MKTKILRHAALLDLAFSLMVSYTVIAANAVEAEPRYIGIFVLGSTIDISSSGIITCVGDARAYNGYTITLVVELQRFDSSWKTIETWEKTASVYVSMKERYSVPKDNKDYRVVTTAVVVEDSSGEIVESPSKKSEVMTY